MSHSRKTSTRARIATLVTAAVLAVAIVAIPVPSALPVLDKLLPVLTLVLGYYFGQKNDTAVER